MAQEDLNPFVGTSNSLDQLQGLLGQMVRHAEALVGKAVELALGGDSAALRICIDRLIPAVKAKDDPISPPPLNWLASR